MIKVFLGIIIIIAVIATFIISVVRTPRSLRGYYGLMYLILSCIGIGTALTLIFYQ